MSNKPDNAQYPEQVITGWIVAVEESGRLVTYGLRQYVARADAESDAKLPQARGQRAEVIAVVQCVRDVHPKGGE